MTVGVNDLKNISLPSAWDNTELRRLVLRDGITYEALIRDINDALSMVNAQLTGGYLANLFSLTTEPTVEYRTGVSNGYEDHTEYTQPDAQRADTSGHMLPIKKIDRALGWTADFLEECRRTQIDADIASLSEDTLNAFEKRLLTRLFKSTEETGKANGLGAAGYSVPFVDGGAGVIKFTPIPKPERGGTFAASHIHYLRLNGITQANVETAVAHLWEHGVDGPYELLISLTDLAAWQTTANVTGFIEKPDPAIMYGTSTPLASGLSAEYVGGVKTKYGFCRMYANGRIPTKYWGVTKSYGAQDQRNPLRVRYDEMFGFGAKLVVDRVALYPLQGAISVVKFGVGTGEDRTGAVMVLNEAANDYVDPTIS